MLTINKTWSALPAGNIQSNQKQNSPRLNTLNKDTVSFKANEARFLKGLRELCKDAGDTFLQEEVMAYAHQANPKHPDVIAEFEKIKKDNSIEKGLKEWILEDLPKIMGIGGGKSINPKWGKDFTK